MIDCGRKKSLDDFSHTTMRIFKPWREKCAQSLQFSSEQLVEGQGGCWKYLFIVLQFLIWHISTLNFSHSIHFTLSPLTFLCALRFVLEFLVADINSSNFFSHQSVRHSVTKPVVISWYQKFIFVLFIRFLSATGGSILVLMTEGKENKSPNGLNPFLKSFCSVPSIIWRECWNYIFSVVFKSFSFQSWDVHYIHFPALLFFRLFLSNPQGFCNLI